MGDMTWGTLLAGLLGAAVAASGGDGTARTPQPPEEAFFPWPPPPVPEEEPAGPARLPTPWSRLPDLLEGAASPANDDPICHSSPLMGGYLYLQGLERRFSTGVLNLGVHLEPLSRWVGNRGDFPAVAGLEVGIRGFPLALMVSAGLRGGDVEMDFVGVGTSWGLARRMLRFLHGD